MPRPSVRNPGSRVYPHTVKRQLEASVTLPDIQKHGFTHPVYAYFLMLPPEFKVVLALESKAVAQVILAVLDATIGHPGYEPKDRRLWVQLSTYELARTGLLSRGAAQRGLRQAVTKGYLLRRPFIMGRCQYGWEYSIRWRGIQN